MPRFYRRLDHTGDIGIEVTARSRRGLFQKAARALMDIMVRAGPETAGRRCTLGAHGEDDADLLRNWLGEVLYLFMGKGIIVSRLRITELTEKKVTATAAGRRFNLRRDRLKTEIKAVTYHQLDVKQVGKTWKARIIFDV